MCKHETAKPFAQGSRLRCHGVELARDRASPNGVCFIGCNQAGPLEPSEKILSIPKPLDVAAQGRGNRIQEVEAMRIGDEHRGRTRVGHQEIAPSFKAMAGVSTKSNITI